MPERTPETDPLSALSILVGEPTAQALVGDVLTDPSFTDEDWGALNQLLQGCRNLRAAAAKNEIDLWGRAR